MVRLTDMAEVENDATAVAALVERPSAEVTPRIEALAKTGIHLGYSRSSRNPRMNRYIYGVRNAVEVFDIAIIDTELEKAKVFIRTLGAEQKQILFVGTKRESRGPISRAATALGMPFVSVRWLGGTLTNFKQIRKRIEELTNLRSERESGGAFYC